MKQHFDAALLQLRHVRLAVFEVVGDEGDLAAERRQDLEDRLHPQRARVVIGSEHARVDDEHAHLGPAVVLEFGWMPFARCRASALPHLLANVAWFTTWWRLTPADSSVPDVWPSKCTTVANGW